MLKTSRSRALDTSRALSVYNEGDLQDVDIQPVRGLQFVVTGMEKAEEDEKHLQEILTAQVLGLQKHQEDLIIPTPEYSTISDYDRIYQGNARKHTQYIHAQPFFHEDYPVYDLDEEDAKFIKEEINDRWKLDLSHSNFEQMISQLERNCGNNATITLDEAKMILKEDDDLILLVYEYWLKKRLKQQHNLIPVVKAEKVGCNVDKRNPYVAFRRRFEKMQTRKNRKLDENNYMMMLKLRRDLSRAVTLLGFIKKRERLKKASLELDLDMVERRLDMCDWDSRIINEIHASRKYKKLEEFARSQELVVSEDDFSTVDSDYESADEGPFQFRRKEGVEYMAPRDWNSSEDEDVSNDYVNPFMWTCVPDVCVSYARRRVGRGGRVVIDRAPPVKRLRPGQDHLLAAPATGVVVVYPDLEPDLRFVDWDPYMSRQDEGQEVCSGGLVSHQSPGVDRQQQVVAAPGSPWRKRYLSGGMKTINMNKVGAHNAASALINNQFIDLFSVGNSSSSST